MANVNWNIPHLTPEEKAYNKDVKERQSRGHGKSARLAKPRSGRERASIKERELTPPSETRAKKSGGTVKRAGGGRGYGAKKGSVGPQYNKAIIDEISRQKRKVTDAKQLKEINKRQQRPKKGTSLEQLELDKPMWEEAPMKGSPGAYNPRKMRVKTPKKVTPVAVKKLSTSRKQAMSPAERKELIGVGVNPKEIKAQLEYKEWQREKDRDAKQTPATLAKRGYGSKKRVAKTGGTVKRKSGGALGTGAALRGFGKGYKKGGTI